MAHTTAVDEALSMAPRKRSVCGYDVDRVLNVVCLDNVGVLGAGKVQGSSYVLKPKLLFLSFYLETAVLSKLPTPLSTAHIYPCPTRVYIRDHLQCHRRDRHRSHANRLPDRSVCLFLLIMQDIRIEQSTVATGTLGSSLACLLFAVIIPSAPYWAFGFPSNILVGFGPDFVYAAGTLYVASIVEPGEQSLSGGLFQTMTQVCCSQLFPLCGYT